MRVRAVRIALRTCRMSKPVWFAMHSSQKHRSSTCESHFCNRLESGMMANAALPSRFDRCSGLNVERQRKPHQRELLRWRGFDLTEADAQVQEAFYGAGAPGAPGAPGGPGSGAGAPGAPCGPGVGTGTGTTVVDPAGAAGVLTLQPTRSKVALESRTAPYSLVFMSGSPESMFVGYRCRDCADCVA